VKHLIKLFMWGYQPHFRANLKWRAEQVFSELGVNLKPEVLLVGALRPGQENDNAVCVEPEDGKWPLSLFSNLIGLIENTVNAHPLQKMFYGDEPSMRDKPENIRRDSVTIALRESLGVYDRDNEMLSFCGAARPVGDYYVVPVIQIPESVFQKFPPLQLPATDDEYLPKGNQSLIHSAIAVLLEEASKALLAAEPGRAMVSAMRSATEIVSEAADRFMNIPDILTGSLYERCDLFQRLNIISSLFYEGMKGLGSLVLVKPDNDMIEYLLRFEEPIPFREPRWARKALQMATANVSLIASGGNIYGLGRLKADRDPSLVDAFTVNFIDHYQWELQCGDLILISSRYREPHLPQEPISQAHFRSNFLRLFPEATTEGANRCWNLFLTAANQRHGSMIIIAEDAASEAERLFQQGSRIRPVLMSPPLLECVSGIDGSIILDPEGVCHAVGVILDGEATTECTPSRGSRFNSAMRYVRSRGKRRLAVVFSDDRTFDIIPLLRPQIDRNEVGKRVNELEEATLENYHMPRLWLDEHRFYVSLEESERVNRALNRIENLPSEMGQMVIITARFKPDPEFNETYFLPE
jgi:hypothetical protein